MRAPDCSDPSLKSEILIHGKKRAKTNGVVQLFPVHTRCRVAIEIGALGKVLMIILVYAARLSEGKRFPLSLSLSKEWGSSCTRRYDHVWVIGCVLGDANRSYVASAMGVGESGIP